MAVSTAMALLDGKRILVTGVLTDASLAFGVAKLAQEQGAEILLTGAGRGLSLTKRAARKLPTEPDVLELDVTDPAQVAAARDAIGERWGRVDGVLHAIGFAPAGCLGGGFLDAGWEDVGVALQISAYSLKALADVVRAAHDRRAAPSSGSTSTTAARPGRPTTGWAWPRPPSSPPPATWPATSGPRASG